jgi:hypothetical protein
MPWFASQGIGLFYVSIARAWDAVKQPLRTEWQQSAQSVCAKCTFRGKPRENIVRQAHRMRREEREYQSIKERREY